MKVKNTNRYDDILFRGTWIKVGETKEIDAKPSDLIRGMEVVRETRSSKNKGDD